MFNFKNVKLVCLMPTYNKQDMLPKAIESVMMQKTDFAYKLVILDDCSTDDSYTIAKQYQAKFPDKIEIVRNKTNLKLLKSITNGYSLLKGVDYFCVLDADDWYIYDKKFADAVAFLESHKDFVVYMTNVIKLQNGVETPFYQSEIEVLDSDYEQHIKGKDIFIQTSGLVYKNVHFKNGISEKFLNGIKADYGYALRSDGFMLPWHLKVGKSHFVNHFESVYNYSKNGIWSSLDDLEQNLLNAQLNIALSHFFPNDKNIFLKRAKNLYDFTIENLRHNNQHIIAKNKDLIFYIYSQTYLTDNPIFDNKSSENLDRLTLTERIFSVKNTPNKKYKVLTILGINFKFKRKKKCKSRL